MRRGAQVAWLLAVLAVAAALACPALAAGPTRPELATTSLTAGAYATPGGPLDLTFTIANRGAGRARASIATFYLSANRLRDRADVALGTAVTVRPLPVRGVLRGVAGPTLPASLPARRYYVLVCADAAARVRESNERNNCRSSARPLTVTEAPTATRELIEAAVKSGSLRAEQALVYRLLGVFGDPRLPAKFRGDAADPDHAILRDVAAAWPGLSPRARATVRPFFTPPAARGTRRAGVVSTARRSLADPVLPCDSDQLAAKSWRSIAGQHVRIWWDSAGEEKLGPRARSMLTEVEKKMWPKMAAIMGRTPLPDGDVTCFNGLEAKLDIYFFPVTGARAVTVPYPPSCKGTPAFMVVAPDATPWVLAHELMHAFQFAFAYSGECADYAPWDEAVATWAAQHVYPQDDYEHTFRNGLEQSGFSFMRSEYEGWPFFLALERARGIAAVGSYYAHSERAEPLPALDAATTLATWWPEFSRLAWNQTPIESFEVWDRFDARPVGNPYDSHFAEATLPAGGTVSFPNIQLPTLSRTYRQVKIEGRPALLIFDNSLAGVPHASVQALIKQADGTWRTEDWTSSPQVLLCPESPAERADELVLIFGNTEAVETFNGFAPPRPPELRAGNVGCARYSGTASGTARTDNGVSVYNESWSAAGVMYARVPGSSPPRFRLQAGSVTWQMQGTQGSGECTVSAGPVTFPVVGGTTDGEITLSLVGSAVKYRAFGTYVNQVPATRLCPDEAPFTFAYTPSVAWLDSGGMGTATPDVATNGTLSGTSGATVGQVTHSWTWSLTPG
jgi:hypothetical protein